MLMAVEALRRVIISSHGHQVAWVARNGVEAVALCASDRPDLILMDLFMPEMDGIEATRRIMAKTPCAIVIVTADVNDHAARVFEAMGAGALDAVNTPALGGLADQTDTKALLAKIEMLRHLIGPVGDRSTGAAKAAAGHPAEFKPGRLVVIGASAGGPAALAKVLSGLPAEFPGAVAIVQHVDAQFAPGLADWLAGQTRLKVRLAEDGDPPEPGTVLLAGKELHLVLNTSSRWAYQRLPADCAHRPSVDVFFESVAKHWKGGVVGVLLTGMGRDGAAGLLALKKHGHPTIAQDRASSAVYGMPKAAAEMNAAGEILPVDKIAPRLTKMMAFKTGHP